MIFGIDVASILLGGLAAGMVLFIVSVGLSVTMGLMGFVNLAHGGFAMIGGYVIVLSMNRWGVGFIPALVLGFVLTAGFSVVLERLLYSRLYRAAELDQVLFTIGLVFMMIAGVTLLVGPENQQIQLPELLRGQMDLGFTRYRTYSVVLIVVGIAFVVALWLGFERTRMGAQIRAAVEKVAKEFPNVRFTILSRTSEQIRALLESLAIARDLSELRPELGPALRKNRRIS